MFGIIPSMSADHPFRAELRKRLYPVLRLYGFRGSGNRLCRYLPPVVHLIAVRGSRYDAACSIELAIELDFVQRYALEQPIAVGKLQVTGEALFSTRLLSPDGGDLGDDLWYYPESIAAVDRKVDAVIQAWERDGVPFFERRKYPEFCKALIDCNPETKRARELVYLAKIALYLGDTTRAVAFARIAVERRPLLSETQTQADAILKAAGERGMEDPADMRRSLGW
jgi:hypothetical protein